MHTSAGCQAYSDLLNIVHQTYVSGAFVHVGSVCWSASPHVATMATWRCAWLEREGVPEAYVWVEDASTAYVMAAPGCDLTRLLTWLQGEAPGAAVLTQDEAWGVSAALSERGWQDAGLPWFTHHGLELERRSAQAPRPDGYTVRPTRRGESADRAECHRRCWSDDRPSPMDAASYAGLQRSPFYRYELDVVAVEPGGGLAAGALLWLDELNAEVLVEPAGCAPEHRRRGLTSAVLSAGLERARLLGARRAVVWPRGDEDYPAPARLYRRLGFEPGGRTRTFTPPPGQASRSLRPRVPAS